MKRILVAMLCVAVCVLSVFPLSACGKGDKNNGNNSGNSSHTHSFTLENATNKYLCSKATCTQSAKYYYSCSCGAKGTATFEYGNANGHNIVNDVCKACKAKASQGLEFTLKDDDTYELKSIGTCTDKDIIIPKTYQGKAVTSIGSYALAAFGGVGAPILDNTPSVPFENITIPDTVTSIGNGAFSGSGELKNIKIPDSVISIWDEALGYCEKLTSVTFGSGIESIDRYVIHMSNAVANIEVGSKNSKYYSKNNCVIEKETKTLVMGCKTSVIPDDVKIIGDSSFWGCSTLTMINIPDGVTLIDSAAFSNCTSLANVIISNSVKTIETSAFASCAALTSVTLGSGVETIVSTAFSDCYKLVEVINNSSFNIEKGDYENGQIGKYALNIKKGGTTDIVNKDGYLFYTYENEDYLLGYVGKDTALTLPNDYNGQTYKIYQYAFNGRNDLTSVVISNGATVIGALAFYNCRGLTNVTIGSSVTSIEASAFRNCVALKNLSIPNGVVSIGAGAFYNCSSLISVIIPNSVTVIDTYAFEACSSLTSVTIGSGVQDILFEAFESCYKLVEVINNSSLEITKSSEDYSRVGYYALNIKKGGTTDIVNKDGFLFYTYENVNYLLGYDGDEVNLVLPNDYNGQTYEIYKYAFYNSNLKSVTIGSGVTAIGENAFINCYDLKSVKFNNVDGWKRYKNIDSENGTEVSREELSDTTTAAEYLTSDYGDFYWKRG